jgi:CubicO group peptidase (beta-lactamase class C family)
VLVQLLVEEAAGAPFERVAHELVLEPLGMAESTFAQGPNDRHVYPEQAAAGLWTTPEDLTRLLLAIQRDMNGAAAMLSPQEDLPAEGEWTALRSLGIEPPNRFGLGLFLSDGWFSHVGGASGFFSALWASLEKGRGAVLMTEGDASPAFFERLLAIANEFGWQGFCAAVDS